MRHDRVSVVIPMYNSSRYIWDTLESVRHQTYKHCEIIVVDDGSNDGSREIVGKYIREHPGLGKLLCHPGNINKGTSSSRNLGIKNADGKLFCFLDSDDLWDPDYLSNHIEIFTQNTDVSMVYGPAKLWYMNRNVGADCIQNLGIRTDCFVDPFALFRKFLDGTADTPSPSGVMFTRKALDKIGGWEEDFPGMYDDQVLYSKLLLHGLSVYVTDKCLYRYRQHDDSLCGGARKRNSHAEAREKYLKWLEKYLMQQGKSNNVTNSIIAEQLWYLERHRELESSVSRLWCVKKIEAVCSLGRFLKKQDNYPVRIRLCWNIFHRNFEKIFAKR